jgi:sulfate transport system ATP-binding protein
VALARALAIEPRVLLLDEPFGALDAQVRRDLRRWLREIHDKTGHTTVFVTHDQEEALELADRVVVMSQGKIEQIGGADDIYDSPASPFVFSFIGESSSLPITVQNGDALFEGRSLRLSAPGVPDGPAKLYMRPHDVELVEPGPLSVTGTATIVRRNGGGRRLEVVVGPDRDRVEIEVAADVTPAVGDSLSFRPRRWRIYPA